MFPPPFPTRPTVGSLVTATVGPPSARAQRAAAVAIFKCLFLSAHYFVWLKAFCSLQYSLRRFDCNKKRVNWPSIGRVTLLCNRCRRRATATSSTSLCPHFSLPFSFSKRDQSAPTRFLSFYLLCLRPRERMVVCFFVGARRCARVALAHAHSHACLFDSRHGQRK